MCSPKSGGTHTPGLEVQGKGECKVVLDGVLSTLEDSGSSLQVCTFSLMSTDEFRDEGLADCCGMILCCH